MDRVIVVIWMYKEKENIAILTLLSLSLFLSPVEETVLLAVFYRKYSMSVYKKIEAFMWKFVCDK